MHPATRSIDATLNDEKKTTERCPGSEDRESSIPAS